MNAHILAQIRNPVLPPILGGAGANANNGGASLGKLISNLVSALFIAGFLLAFMQMLIGAVSWITAGGDKQKLETARNQITNAIMGLIIVAGTFAVMSLIARFFGLDLSALTIPSISK